MTSPPPSPRLIPPAYKLNGMTYIFWITNLSSRIIGLAMVHLKNPPLYFFSSLEIMIKKENFPSSIHKYLLIVFYKHDSIFFRKLRNTDGNDTDRHIHILLDYGTLKKGV